MKDPEQVADVFRPAATGRGAGPRAKTRWPEWRKKALDLGVRSLLDVPLWTGTGTVGVLGLSGKLPDAFGPDDEAVASILARHAAVAVDARKVVGRAMGILMERYTLTSDQAFHVLRRYSQNSITKLREVAEYLITSGRLSKSDEFTHPSPLFDEVANELYGDTRCGGTTWGVKPVANGPAIEGLQHGQR